MYGILTYKNNKIDFIPLKDNYIDLLGDIHSAVTLKYSFDEYNFFYLDDENDKINFSNNLEYQEALRMLKEQAFNCDGLKLLPIVIEYKKNDGKEAIKSKRGDDAYLKYYNQAQRGINDKDSSKINSFEKTKEVKPVNYDFLIEIQQSNIFSNESPLKTLYMADPNKLEDFQIEKLKLESRKVLSFRDYIPSQATTESIIIDINKEDEITQMNNNQLSYEYNTDTRSSVFRDKKCFGCKICPIEGILYQCFKCDDLNFCEKCEASEFGEVHEHALIKVRTEGQLNDISKVKRSICIMKSSAIITCPTSKFNVYSQDDFSFRATIEALSTIPRGSRIYCSNKKINKEFLVYELSSSLSPSNSHFVTLSLSFKKELVGTGLGNNMIALYLLDPNNLKLSNDCILDINLKEKDTLKKRRELVEILSEGLKSFGRTPNAEKLFALIEEYDDNYDKIFDFLSTNITSLE